MCDANIPFYKLSRAQLLYNIKLTDLLSTNGNKNTKATEKKNPTERIL